MDPQILLSTTLKSNQAFNVKTHNNTWYTVYTNETLEKVINSGDFQSIHIRKTA